LGLGYDKRIGFEYLRPGPGWGGSCLPKDTRALVHIAEQAGYDFSFLRGAIATNDEQFVRVVNKVKAAVASSIGGGPVGRATSDGFTVEADPSTSGDEFGGAVIAVWGLTFKAGTDDLRNSPAIEVAQRLVRGGATVQAFDPTVSVPAGQASASVPGLSGLSDDGYSPASGGALRAFPDAYAACRGAVAVVVLTEWDEFRWLDFDRVRTTMAIPVVVDARNLLDPAQLRRLGFEYTGIGRR
jgi:UDPglucose 6-dehydrogenase